MTTERKLKERKITAHVGKNTRDNAKKNFELR